MCTHSRLIYNRYTHKMVRVSCGKCKECRQEKACARANRIRNHSVFGEIPLFVTLTYSPMFIPYILRSELKDDLEIGVYRDASVRLYRGKPVYNYNRVLLDKVFITDYKDFGSVPYPRKSPKDYIGVIYYKDLQNFFKRFRIILNRDYPDVKIPTSYFSCAEYGSTTKRPHFHSLLFIRQCDEEKVRLAIGKAWLFADMSRTQEYIEIAKNAASYVASYVNSHFSTDSILADDSFRQKHSYSKGFGVRLQCFSLASILEKVERHDLHYYVQKTRDGVPCVDSLPIPKYVISRYFPQPTGYFLLAPDEIRKFLLRTEQYCDLVQTKSYQLTFSKSDRHRMAVRFSNIFSKFHDELGWTYEKFCIEYPLLFEKVWSIYKSMILEDSYNSVISLKDWYDFYENANELVMGVVHSDLSVFDTSCFVLNPNLRSMVLRKSSHLLDIYYKLDKNRKVVNYAMSHSNHFV